MADVQGSINQVVSLFNKTDWQQKVALAVFPSYAVPSSYWSLTNKIIMILSGTHDARGFKQWQNVGRRIKKGCHAFAITAPRMHTIENKKSDGTIEKKNILSGFMGIPVFRYEDTEGAELDIPKLEIPPLPFLSVAESVGITVKPSFAEEGQYGYYSMSQKLILLRSPETMVFFHELSHAIDDKIGTLKNADKVECEIVAQMCAAVLGVISGTFTEDKEGQFSVNYVKKYAQLMDLSPEKAVLKLLHRIEKIINFIVDFEKNREKQNVSIEHKKESLPEMAIIGA